MITVTERGDLKLVTVEATTLPDAWFQTLQATVSNGRVYTITEGSYSGSLRCELDCLTLHITHPHDLPLLPDMPKGMEKFNPVPGGMKKIEEYLPYLMSDGKKKNEAYTYGQRLFGSFFAPFPPPTRGMRRTSQVEEVIEKYKRGFGNNQCCMTVALPEDVTLEDPPCLRSIDTRIFTDEQREGPPKLHFYLKWRSWDVYCGLPANLAVIVHLQQYMAEMIGVEAGEIISVTKGAHLYDMYWDFASRRLGD
jgi:thymidylate synthase